MYGGGDLAPHVVMSTGLELQVDAAYRQEIGTESAYRQEIGTESAYRPEIGT